MKPLFKLSPFTSLFIVLAILPWKIDSDLNSDKRALLEFAKSVTKTRKLNWNPTTQICSSWIGITCTRDRTSVSEIHLPSMGLYGFIPSNTVGKLNALTVLSLRSNYFHGNIPSDIFTIPSLQSLYLESNNFSGEIPDLPLPPRLSVVDLSFNSLTGEFPSSFMALKRLSVLRLEFNSISGVIPNLDIPSLVLLNLSFNSFDGEIPLSLQKFPVSSFMGNSRLCGLPMTYCATPENSSASISAIESAKNSRKLSLIPIIGITIGGVFLLLILVLAILLRKKVRVRDNVIKAKKANDGDKNENLKSEDFGSGVQGGEKIKLAIFKGCSFSFDFEDMLRASAEVLGKGGLGTSYKAILDESTTVVVKRLKNERFGKKEFEQYIENVNRIGQHPNVVPMIAYHCSKDEKLLVYEYLSASLSAALHGKIGKEVRNPLDWNTRINIALGAARGISHIHSAKITHGNIKSSNILLTETLDPRVSEFGLSPLTPYTHVKNRAPACQAPEITANPLLIPLIYLDGYAPS